MNKFYKEACSVYKPNIYELIELIQVHHKRTHGPYHNVSPVQPVWRSFKVEIYNKIDKTDDCITDKQFLGFWTQYDCFPSLLIDTWTALEKWKTALNLEEFYPSDYSFYKIDEALTL